MNELPEPVTRAEKYFASIAGQETELPEPVTRAERYLAKIAGQEVETPPAPVTRAEQYLDYIAQIVGTAVSGSGLYILVTAPTGSTVTAAKDAKTYASTESAESPGTYTVQVPEYGTYTVTAALGDQTASGSVTLAAGTVVLRYSLLPEGYTPLEYIESTGTQYINTGVIPPGDRSVGFFADVLVNASEVMSGLILCGLYEAAAALPRVYFGQTGINGEFVGNLIIGYGANYATTVPNSVLCASRRVQMDALLTDGEQSLSFSTGETFSMGEAHGFPGNTAPLYLLAMNWAGRDPTNIFKGRVYGARIALGGKTVRNFVPCSRSGGEIGLYDTVDGVFYPNAGKGKFTAGPEV